MSRYYQRGHTAGYAAAVEREHTGDVTAADADQGATWFTTPAAERLDEDAAAEYERGFLAGWAEYLGNRH
ncbi:hypothetical protein [Rhodococcus sp. LW-XY12]|uniref:hypothetical protein n=1 Tax=Rhodococcus sp. LW-XY12 TaxID=2856851 RepID=UPI001C58BC9F|nr:hypothetical protein [Rhodococcus sp. LW-XY12]QXU56574.1 hypothetical protein KXC42_25970 [Rhodococcus sp. LW-XY12]